MDPAAASFSRYAVANPETAAPAAASATAAPAAASATAAPAAASATAAPAAASATDGAAAASLAAGHLLHDQSRFLPKGYVPRAAYETLATLMIPDQQEELKEYLLLGSSGVGKSVFSFHLARRALQKGMIVALNIRDEALYWLWQSQSNAAACYGFKSPARQHFVDMDECIAELHKHDENEMCALYVIAQLRAHAHDCRGGHAPCDHPWLCAMG
jgi:hypothetical protein